MARSGAQRRVSNQEVGTQSEASGHQVLNNA